MNEDNTRPSDDASSERLGNVDARGWAPRVNPSLRPEAKRHPPSYEFRSWRCQMHVDDVLAAAWNDWPNFGPAVRTAWACARSTPGAEPPRVPVRRPPASEQPRGPPPRL